MVPMAIFGELTDAEREHFLIEANEKDRFENAILILNGQIDLLSYPLQHFQVGQLNQKELRLLRNMIYAKHGYIFMSEDLKAYYSRFAWYEENLNFNEDLLTSVDKFNIEFIRSFEEENIDSININEIIGGWHVSPIVAAGYENLFIVTDEGEIEWRANEMNWGKRLISYHGTYNFEVNKLKIKIKKFRWLYGKDIVEPYASAGSKYVINSEDIRDIDISSFPIEITIPLRDFGETTVPVPGNIGYFGAEKFWKMP